MTVTAGCKRRSWSKISPRGYVYGQKAEVERLDVAETRVGSLRRLDRPDFLESERPASSRRRRSRHLHHLQVDPGEVGLQVLGEFLQNLVIRGGLEAQVHPAAGSR